MVMFQPFIQGIRMQTDITNTDRKNIVGILSFPFLSGIKEHLHKKKNQVNTF